MPRGGQVESSPSSAPAQVGHAPTAVIRDVTVTFGTTDGGTRDVLHEVSLAVAPGEVLVLIGRSGCGKTTILNLLAGLVVPSHGEVEVLGFPPARVRARMSYMFARDALLPWRTAGRNVELALEVRGVSKDQRRRSAREMLARVGLEAYEDYYIWQLSQGMRQRVALARTWVGSPEVLLLDEPFAALDAQTRLTIHAVFLDLWAKDRRTVIFVTHDLHEAIVLGDRILVLGNGTIVDDISVRFPRPRETTRLMEDAAYVALVRRLHNLIEVPH